MTLNPSTPTACLALTLLLELAKSLTLDRQMTGSIKKLIALTGFGIHYPSSNLLDNKTYRNKMINYIKERMRQPTPLEMITNELAMAHLAKLEAETAVDFARSVVAYNDARIKRLEVHLTQHSKEQTK